MWGYLCNARSGAPGSRIFAVTIGENNLRSEVEIVQLFWTDQAAYSGLFV